MDYKPRLSMTIDGNTYSYKLFDALKLISNMYSQRRAAKKMGISHAVLNRRIKDAEEKLGFKLTYSTGAGSILTDDALKILKKYDKYTKRLKQRKKIIICGGYASTRLMEILAFEYGLDASIYKTGDKEALYLASLDMVDILTLDDPVHALINDLDFTPIAYDYLVLISSTESSLKSIDKLEGKNFIEIENSPQRLAWNTLDDAGIPYKLKSGFKSPYDALKFVRSHNDVYTFINHSLEEGSDIIKNETMHVISFISCNHEDNRIDDFLKFILTFRGQRVVEKSGFEKVR
ncbi:LysR family transcriptional regulator [Methanobacterium sp. ACI-7]|uniref:LysR family transcriptional regulator n=1 Tax=unclassified Methanobacterium TaxID=2627676 RepID=UPI0039C28EBA